MSGHDEWSDVQESKMGGPSALVLLLLICGVLGSAVWWASTSKIDEVTRAPGTVITSSRLQTVQAVDGGIIAKIAVQEGQTVEKGQLLVQLDTGRSAAGAGESAARVAALSVMIARAKAEIEGKAPVWPSGRDYSEIVAAQQTQYTRRLQGLREEISVMEKSQALAESELALNRPLVKDGIVSQAEIIRLERQVNEVRSQIAVRRNRYFSEAQAELTKAQDELAAAKQVLAGRNETVSQMEITARVRGIVKNVRVTTIGGVLRAAEEIMQIVPLEDTLQVEAKIRPADIGFMKPGLEASVKLDAFDSSIYGSMKGRVSFISPDTLRDENSRDEQRYYRAIITISDFDLKARPNEKIEIIPGMTSLVEIKTGQKTVMQYLLKPINKTLNEALSER
jgi:membrane fusion protein, adhesin transport system